MYKTMNQNRKFNIDERRYAQLDTEISRVGDENSTEFQITFASEKPYQRWYGNEVLSHKNDDVNYETLNHSGMFLFNHDPNQYIGTVKKAWNDGSKSYAIVDISSSSNFAQQILNDIRNGTLKNISVGYEVKNYDEIIKAVHKNNYDDTQTYRVQWLPREISIAPVPADPSVGFGRSIDVDFKPPHFDISDNNQDDQIKSQENLNMDIKTTENQHAEIIQAEKERMSLIMSMSKKHQLDDVFTKNLIDECRTTAEVNARLVQFFTDRDPSALKPVPQKEEISKKSFEEFGITEKEMAKYNVQNVLRALDSKNYTKIGFEQEYSELVKRQMRQSGIKDVGDIYMPMSFARNSTPHLVGNLESAGTLVDTDYRYDLGVEYLRKQTMMLRLGAKILTNQTGFVDVPVDTYGGENGYWVAENGKLGFEVMRQDRIKFEPKTVGVIQSMSSLMSVQSPDFEQRMKKSILNIIAQKIDEAILYGLGSSANQPLGLFNNDKVQDHTLATAGKVTFDDLLDMRTAVRNKRIMSTYCRYMTSPNVINKLQKIKSNNGEYLWTRTPDGGLSDGVPGLFNGIPVVENDMLVDTPTSSIIFGDFSQLMQCIWGDAIGLKVLDQVEDVAYSGGSMLRGMVHTDVKPLRPEAFCIAQGITN